MIDPASDDIAARGLLAIARAAAPPAPVQPAPLTAEDVRGIIREELIAWAALNAPTPPIAEHRAPGLVIA